MKIISKHKDYYDYLTGVYGVDPVLVYDRRHKSIVTLTNAAPTHERNATTFSFYICNKQYNVLEYGGRYYFGPDDLFLLFKKLKANHESLKYTYNEYYISYSYNFPLTRSDDKYLRRRAEEFHAKYGIIPTEVNKKERQPVLMRHWGGFALPVLSTTPIPSIIPAAEIYNEISLFLGWLKDNPEAPQINNNDCKIKAAGFDVKDSFRPNKR